MSETHNLSPKLDSMPHNGSDIAFDSFLSALAETAPGQDKQ